MLAVDLDTPWVGVVVAPDIDFFRDEHEISSSLPVKSLVFLDWVDWKLEKVGATHDVPL